MGEPVTLGAIDLSKFKQLKSTPAQSPAPDATESTSATPITLGAVDLSQYRGLQPRLIATPVEKPAPRKSLPGKIYSAVVALPKTVWRELTYTLPTALGHLSAGDSAAAAAVPGFTRLYKAAYQDATNPVSDTMRLIGQVAAVTPMVGEVVAYGARALGYATVGTPKEQYQRDALETIQRIRDNFIKGRGVGYTIKRLIDKHYPQYGSGFSVVTYKAPGIKQVQTARIPNTSMADWAIEAGKRGYKVTGVEVMEPVRGILGATTGDILAFLADVSDPILAATFGTAARLGFKGISLVGKAVRKVPGITNAVQVGIDAVTNATKTGTWLGNALDKIEAGYGTIRLGTARVRKRLYGMAGGRLESLALREQIKEQAQMVANILSGRPGPALRLARGYLAAEAAGDTVRMEQYGAALINHGTVGFFGDIGATARSIVNIAEMPVEKRKLLNKLALAWREGDTTLESVLKRIEPQVPKMPAEMRKAYRELRAVAREEARIVEAAPQPKADPQLQLFPTRGRKPTVPKPIPGLQIGDVEVLANALTLPRGGLGVMSDTVKKAMNDYVEIVKGNIPKHLIPTKPEIEAILAKSPGLVALEEKQLHKIAAGMKVIDIVSKEGMSEFIKRQMQNGIERSVATRFGDTPDLAKLVDRWITAEAYLREHGAMGAFAGTRKLRPSELQPNLQRRIRERALQVRAAVEAEAVEQGISVDVLRDAVKLGATLDEAIGRMEVELGIITKEQFEGLKGLHIRRSYELFPEIEKRLYAMSKTDPVKYARLQDEYIRYKERLSSFENVNIVSSPGGVGTSIARPREDLTPEFRQFLEQIENYGDALLLSGKQAAKTISNATFYKAIYEAGLASDTVDLARGFTEPIGFKSIKGELIPDPSWGALAGKWTSKPIAADLRRFAVEEMARDSILQKIWSAYIIRPIKMTLVPLNLVARMHNTFSNFIQHSLGVGDASLVEFVKWKSGALASLLERSPQFQLHARYSPSVREASIVGEVMARKQFAEGISATLEKVFMSRPFRLGVRSMAWEEAWDKHAFFLRAIAPVDEGGLGMTAREAALEAEKWVVDYSNVPPVIDWLRRKVGVTPFITYTYKMAGNLVRGPIKNPQVLAQLTKPIVGLNDIVPEEIRNAEKEGLPPYLHGKLVVRLPGKEPRYINLDPYLPWNIFDPDAMDAAPEFLRPALGMLGPPFSTFMELAMNRNKLTGADIVPEGADDVTAAKLRWDYIVKSIPQVRQVNNLIKAFQGVPINTRQMPQKWYEVLMEIRHYDLDKIIEFRYTRALNEYRKIVGYATQTNQNELLDDTIKDERVSRILALAEKKRQEVLYLGSQMIKIKGLDKILAMSGIEPKLLKATMQWFVEQSEPSSDLRDRVRAIGQTLIPGQDTREVILGTGRFKGMSIPAPPTPAPPQPPNMERMGEAFEKMQPPEGGEYELPPGYSKPQPGPQ